VTAPAVPTAPIEPDAPAPPGPAAVSPVPADIYSATAADWPLTLAWREQLHGHPFAELDERGLMYCLECVKTVPEDPTRHAWHLCPDVPREYRVLVACGRYGIRWQRRGGKVPR
jgi:hypothetical protein